MSNKNGSLKLSLAYTNPDGDSSKQDVSVAFHYQAQSHGTIDVPDTTASATAYEIPFGSIDVAATMVVIANRTGQSCEVKVNGQAVVSHHHDIASGGVFVIGGPAAPAANPITSVSLTLKDTQSGAGLIAYHIFGDET